MIPLLVLCFLPMWRLYRPKGDYRKDLQVTVLEKRTTDSLFEILGTVQNNGKTEWENIELNVEFYSAEGKFIDEAFGRVSSTVEPGKSEHFKIAIPAASDRIRAESSRMELKVASAYSSMF